MGYLFKGGKQMSIIDLEDAVRAAQDRPSMEAELQELREQLLATEKARDYHIEQLGQLREDRDCALEGIKNETKIRDRYCAALQRILDNSEPGEFWHDVAANALKGEGDL
jgi:plasmid stability protein